MMITVKLPTEVNEVDELDKALKIAQFMKDTQGNLKKVNNYSGIGAAVRTMIEGGVVKTNIHLMTT